MSSMSSQPAVEPLDGVKQQMRRGLDQGPRAKPRGDPVRGLLGGPSLYAEWKVKSP